MRVSDDTFWSIGFKIFGILLLLFLFPLFFGGRLFGTFGRFGLGFLARC